MRAWTRGLLVGGACLGVGGYAAAQERRPLVLPPAFIVDQWTTRDGLPQNSVNAIARAPDGSLWIGTFGGLVRFDGASFRLQERFDSAGRHVDRVLSLAIGRDSTLWIGTEDGLLRYKDRHYDSYASMVPLKGHAISALFVDHGGVLWVGTARGGLVRHAGERVETIAEVDHIPLGPVTSIAEDSAGTLWVNAGDRLVAIAGSTGTARWAVPAPGALDLALQDRDGVRWFGLSDGVAAVSARGIVREYHRRDGVRRPSIMIEDREDGWWLGTINDGLFHLGADGARLRVTPYPLPDGQTQFRLRSGLVDDEGNIWFGTNANGLLRVRRNVFTTFTHEQGLSHDVATAVYVDAGGLVWEGTNCGGLNVMDLTALSVRTLKPRRPGDPNGDPCVFALTESPRGTMWAGTWGGGLTRLRAGREERLGLAGGLRDSVVLALFTDRHGTVWVGTSSGGLAMVQGGRVRAVYTTTDGLVDNRVRTIFQSRDGDLWIGTLGGLSRLHDGQFTNFTAADGLSAEPVRAIYEDAVGSLWIGTYGGGLNRFRHGVFTAITRRDGLADDIVSAILEDDQGRLWMSGNRGIYRASRLELSAFADGRAKRVHCVLYGEKDGLRNAETNGGFQPAAWEDARGRLWFPTVRGVAMVEPARLKVVDRPPSVSVEEVVVDGEARIPGRGLAIGPGRANVEFRYTGVSLSSPEHLTYRYRLFGYDDDWVEAGTRRVAYYPRLPPGRYRFAVTAANRDGVWNETGTELPLRVVAPLWSTWWFRLLAAAALLWVVAVVSRRRLIAARSARAAREEFSRRLIESQEHERRRIAGELHDGLGQELLVVKNRTMLALGASNLPPSAREQLEQVDAIVTQSLAGVRGLAHNLTPYQLDHLGLSEALRAMISTSTTGVATTLRATVESVDGLLATEMEINLFRIVQEAVNNILRHAEATLAEIRVRRLGDAIVVTISDDGRGFEVRRDGERGLVGGFGLSGIAERVRILGGDLDLASVPGGGTRLEVTVPIVARRDAERT